MSLSRTHGVTLILTCLLSGYRRLLPIRIGRYPTFDGYPNGVVVEPGKAIRKPLEIRRQGKINTQNSSLVQESFQLEFRVRVDSAALEDRFFEGSLTSWRRDLLRSRRRSSPL